MNVYPIDNSLYNVSCMYRILNILDKHHECDENYLLQVCGTDKV